MILHKMRLVNFRQFQGTQEIEFASGATGQVTVIFGANGRGKTGIYRALLFCLYGEKRLSQDAQVDDSELYLVNYPEMEARSSEKKPVEASVYVEFSHDGGKYEIKRSILGILNNGRVIEQHNEIRLVKRDELGNASTTRDPQEVADVVGGILDRGLREYFLFDGEKIERLTRASLEQKREISMGVRKLLDIDTLETAMKATKRLWKYLDSQIEERATGEWASVIKLLRENDERSISLRDKYALNEKELQRGAQEKKQVDVELDKIREIRDLLTARTDLENKEKEFETQVENILREMKDRTGKTALLLVRKTAERVYSNVDMRKQKHEIPSQIRRDLIDRLISDERCICGTPIKSGTDEHRCILVWRNRIPDNETEDSMLDLWRYLATSINLYEDIGLGTETLLQKYAVTKHDLQVTHRKLDELRQKIGSSERSDAAKLDKYRQQIERKIIQLEGDQAKVQKELADLNEDREVLQQQRKEIEKEKGIRDELAKRAALAEATTAALQSIHEEFTGEARDMISAGATKYFRQLLDDESKQTLRDVVVNSDYSIQVYDRWQKPFLANISSGQRQIMSIAFIAALAGAAAGAEILEMPLFMDTPFGRLSHEHRQNLLQNVPKWCSQWILLATDTEFGRLEADILRSTENWTKFYVLKGAGAGSTKIEAVDVGQANGLLRDEAEVA